ncbi:MAG: undecaprenyldiphospho-muramoylpentapeptide beta-N-acetylglucosaminyltransferase [Bacteroidota bacterium]
MIPRRKEVCNLLRPETRIIISGGGTGGHIFPALAIAEGLRKIDASIKILFVGAKGRMEMEKIPAEGYEIVGLNISGFNRSFSWSNLSFPFKVVFSLIKALSIVKKFKPNAAVGVGGYASGPLLWAASKSGVPTVIQEQNSYPGITNKLLASKAHLICTGYDGMEHYFPASKILVTGNPVRNEMVDILGKKDEALSFFGLEKDKPVILVVGGSQGALAINKAILQGLSALRDSGVQLIWQTGVRFLPEALEAINTTGYSGARAFDFIKRMDYAYAASDLVISRAGASTVSELCVVGKPAIMVPLPTAAEDHQTHNCMSLVKKGAAILVKNSDASHLLVAESLKAIHDTELLHSLGENMLKLAVTDAAQRIANEVYAIALKHQEESVN